MIFNDRDKVRGSVSPFLFYHVFSPPFSSRYLEHSRKKKGRPLADARLTPRFGSVARTRASGMLFGVILVPRPMRTLLVFSPFPILRPDSAQTISVNFAETLSSVSGLVRALVDELPFSFSRRPRF